MKQELRSVAVKKEDWKKLKQLAVEQEKTIYEIISDLLK